MNEGQEAYRYERETETHTIKRKFSSGNTVELVFSVTETDDSGPLYVEVELRSFAKRKHKSRPDYYQSVHGRDGLEPAIWATQRLLEFPEFLLRNYYYGKNEVIYLIYWTDSRRRDVYHKWLSRYGFYFGVDMGAKCLTKTYTKSASVEPFSIV